MFRIIGIVGLTLATGATTLVGQSPLQLRVRYQQPGDHGTVFENVVENRQWDAAKTAIIVCDLWDYHHCLNAVRRINEFAPRLNQVLTAAREQGVTIIHAPSDCMGAYREHPARMRAVNTKVAASQPLGIEHWCSVIPAEERVAYPIDQSDGGEDDDPDEHAEWAKQLSVMGRNPQMPWKRQNDQLTIDADADFISDRGDEVWNVLTDRGIEHVILVGVHTNMCVLGRPFGLRRLVLAGKEVVLMRDMTDTMYNPKRWPYVSHFEGTRRIISHIERYVCPTISSNQIVGGQEFRFAGDDGSREPNVTDPNPSREWVLATLPSPAENADHDVRGTVVWYRCAVHFPSEWMKHRPVLRLSSRGKPQVWINGQRVAEPAPGVFDLREPLIADDTNLVVVRLGGIPLTGTPCIESGPHSLSLGGQWQRRTGVGIVNQGIPLPAKFGIGPDIVFDPNLER